MTTGSGTAAVQVYGGTRPATAADAPGSTMLVELPLENAVGVVAGGVLTLDPAAPALIAVSGSATWCRAVTRNGDTAFDMDAGAVASGAECELSDVALFAGGLVTILSAVLG